MAMAWTFDGSDMVTPAFFPIDLQLLTAAPQYAIENVPLPGGGSLAQDGWPVEITHQILYKIKGAVDFTGAAHPNFGHGLAENYAELVTRVGNPATWGGSTGATSVTRLDGVVMTGDIQVTVSPMTADSGQSSPVGRCIVSVTIPAGYLTTGSPIDELTGLGGIWSYELAASSSVTITVECEAEGASTPAAMIVASATNGGTPFAGGSWSASGPSDQFGANGVRYLGITSFPPPVGGGFLISAGVVVATYTFATPATGWVRVVALDSDDAGDSNYRILTLSTT